MPAVLYKEEIMLWISDNARWEASLNWQQWMVGFNVWDSTVNVFIGPLRFARNSDATAAILRK